MLEAVDAQELMRQVGHAYSQFESYQDAGYVESIHSPGTPDESRSRLTFSTFFHRPNLFRFQWQSRYIEKSPLRTSIIWCDGEKAYKKYGQGKIARGKSLELVIAGAAGVSRATAYTIPALLMSEIGGNRPTQRGGFVYIANELIAGEECYRLRHDAPHETDLWISTSRSVVLKIFEQYIVGEDPAPSKWLRERAFKSISGFIRWLKMRKDFAWAEEEEPFHVIEQTHYTNVILNEQIPREAFTLEGLT
jgi:hypothetical protein